MHFARLSIADKNYEIRQAQVSDVPMVTKLLHAAYRELADQGLNYTAIDQDESVTLEQIQQRRTLLVFDKIEMIATISVHDENWFTKNKTLYVTKFAVQPKLKKQGIGKYLLQYIENLAIQENYEGLQLDTAKPAKHLVEWYQRFGFKIIGDTHFEGKTYESWIFEKQL